MYNCRDAIKLKILPHNTVKFEYITILHFYIQNHYVIHVFVIHVFSLNIFTETK
jgi:hypothetical protein